MKLKYCLYYLLVISFTSVFAQVNNKDLYDQDSTLKVAEDKKDHYTFEGIEIEDESSSSYKTLEIRYKRLKDLSAKEIVVDGETYLCFRDKRSAISYYNIIKKNAAKSEVYYVNSKDKKEPERFSFRVSE